MGEGAADDRGPAVRLYHGGVPGLQVGDAILPPDLTGTEHRLSVHVPPGAPHGTRTDRVYLTTSRGIAETYAALYPDGALYEVEQPDSTEPDPDAPDAAVMVRSAVVRRVVDPVVLFRSRSWHYWLRRLTRKQEADR